MGYGAHMNITNNRPGTITTYVNNVQCMYQDGDSNSYLNDFNDCEIGSGGTYPGGQGAYIEAKDSDTCFFQSAQFTIKVCDSNNSIIGNVSFSDDTHSWKLSDNTNPDVIDVDINNDQNPGTIAITVAAS